MKSTVSIEERISEMRKEYPKPSIKTYIYDKGKCVWEGESIDKPINIPSKYKNYVVQHVEDKESYDLALSNYYNELNSLLAEAYDNLANFMGWEDIDSEIVDWIKHRCWEDGHSAGYSEVLNIANDYEELVEILRAKGMAQTSYL